MGLVAPRLSMTVHRMRRPLARSHRAERRARTTARTYCRLSCRVEGHFLFIAQYLQQK